MSLKFGLNEYGCWIHGSKGEEIDLGVSQAVRYELMGSKAWDFPPCPKKGSRSSKGSVLLLGGVFRISGGTWCERHNCYE